MGHLVTDDSEYPLPLTLGGCCRVKKKMILRIEDGTPVFHRAASYFPRRGDQVEFRQRKWHAKIAVVVVEQSDRFVECVSRFGRVAALKHCTDIHAVYRSVDALEVADT